MTVPLLCAGLYCLDYVRNNIPVGRSPSSRVQGARPGLPWEPGAGASARVVGAVSAGRRRNVNCLKNVVIWYEDHRHRCPYEPHLAELDPTFGLYTTAVWQCEAGHRYFQDLHSPLKPLSDSDPDSDKGGFEEGGRPSPRYLLLFFGFT